MNKKLNVLIIDDHPMIVEAYKNILESADLEEYDFDIDTADDCDSAIKKIEVSAKTKPYDILFSDVKLPPSIDGEIISGEDLSIFAKKILPNARIVILTMFDEGHRIQNILKTVNPDGLLIKNDLTSTEFLVALDVIINNPPYYSSTVAKFFRQQSTGAGESLLDHINRKIIYHLSEGVKTKDLTNYIHLSLSAIEKRKTQIKNLLEVECGNDEILIREAKVRGFI